MKADTSVKWFHHEMAASPVLRGQVGSLIELLDATLVNGFDVRVVNSLVVADGVATATISAGHAYLQHAVIALSGATPAELNDEWRIKSVAGNTFSFDCDLPDGTATGTITVKMAPAGWAKVFAGANKAVYQSTDLAGTQLYLRVDDSFNTYSLACGYESMTSVDDGVNPFMISNKYGFRKHYKSAASARPWSFVADRRLFYYMPAYREGASGWGGGRAAVNIFGDIVSYWPGDAYHCCIALTRNVSAAITPGTDENTTGAIGTSGFSLFARNVEQAIGSVACTFTSYGTAAGGSGSEAATKRLPGDGRMRFASVMAISGASAFRDPVRGHLPGYYISLDQSPVDLQNYGIERIDGRLLMRVRVSIGGGSSDSSGYIDRRFVAFDIEGPWR